MPQVGRYDVEMSVLKGEVIRDASFIANHAAHGAFGNLHGTHIRCLLK